MALSMEVILSDLKQANEQLENAVKIGKVRIINVNGSKQRTQDVSINKKDIEEAKDLIDYIIETEITAEQGMKTEKDLSDIKEEIDKLLETLQKVQKEKELQDAKYAAEKQSIEDTLTKVKGFQGDLVDKQKAIDEYSSRGYNIQEHLEYEENKKKRLERELDDVSLSLNAESKYEELFKDEFDKYVEASEKMNKIAEIEVVCDEFIQLKADYDAENDDNKKKEIEDRCKEAWNKYAKLRSDYIDEYGDKDVDLPKTGEALVKDGKTNIDKAKNELSKQKLDVSNDFKSKIDDIYDLSKRPIVVKNQTAHDRIKAFCDAVGINCLDVINNDLETVIKIKEEQIEKCNTSMVEKIKQITAIRETVKKLKVVENAEKDFNEINDKSDEELKSSRAGLLFADEYLQDQMRQKGLLASNVKDIKKKSLVSTWASINGYGTVRRFFMRINPFNRNSLYGKIYNHYKDIGANKYVEKTKSEALDKYNKEKEKKEKFAEQYKAKGKEDVLKGKNDRANRDARFYEEFDNMER